MCTIVKFISNSLLLSLVCCSLTSVHAANVINYRQQQHVSYTARPVNVLPSQQQPQLQSARYEQHSQQTQIATKEESIFRPMVRFLTAKPTLQQSQVIGNRLPATDLAGKGNQQLNLFISQQQQQAIAPPARVSQHLQHGIIKFQSQQQFQTKFNHYQNLNWQLQQSKSLPSPPTTSKQLPNNQQFVQYNSYVQHQYQQQQQQAFNLTRFVRVNQKSQQEQLQQQQQQRQQYQVQQPQQSLQSQQQRIQFYRPQTTKTTQQYSQPLKIYSQPSNSYQHPHPQQEQQQQQLIHKQNNFSVVASRFNSSDVVISPLLPSYSDEEDALTPFNFTQPCQDCCVERQNPCQRCCDTRPFLSAAVLKSSTG
ncbi:putative mediator of RNA polymerase II transcription subunit 26 [Anastrepha ludens]|uniref:putative mediator of RNA polymerase II transcription subunit 26 n=1 Tax=Anastrepha ludens TaxID=28586 RepID=UPI0023AF6B44|nr:putative mediator of RNA polymerase II transcription subunit 26 [Anastrepha ludens]